MAQIVRQSERLGEIVVEPERARQRAGDLRDLKGMGQTGAVMIALMRHENLGFVGEATKRRGMNDPVAVALELAACGRWSFWKLTAAAQPPVGRPGSQ